VNRTALGTALELITAALTVASLVLAFRSPMPTMALFMAGNGAVLGALMLWLAYRPWSSAISMPGLGGRNLAQQRVVMHTLRIVAVEMAAMFLVMVLSTWHDAEEGLWAVLPVVVVMVMVVTLAVATLLAARAKRR